MSLHSLVAFGAISQSHCRSTPTQVCPLSSQGNYPTSSFALSKKLLEEETKKLKSRFEAFFFGSYSYSCGCVRVVGIESYSWGNGQRVGQDSTQGPWEKKKKKKKKSKSRG